MEIQMFWHIKRGNLFSTFFACFRVGWAFIRTTLRNHFGRIVDKRFILKFKWKKNWIWSFLWLYVEVFFAIKINLDVNLTELGIWRSRDLGIQRSGDHYLKNKRSVSESLQVYWKYCCFTPRFLFHFYQAKKLKVKTALYTFWFISVIG